MVIHVTSRVELIEAAQCLAMDNTKQLQRWLESGELVRATDDHARDWVARDPQFMCVVAAPWVLVQEHSGG